MLKTGTFCELVGMTTRIPRWGEVNGRDYHFVSHAKMQEMIDGGQMVEWNKLGDQIYGTPVLSLQTALASGKVPAIILEPNGVVNMHRYCMGNGIRLVPIWLDVSTEVQAARFIERAREQPAEVSAKRLAIMLSEEPDWPSMMPVQTVWIPQRGKTPESIAEQIQGLVKPAV